MIFKTVLRYSPPERLLRLYRIVWERGKVGFGGYSAKFSVGVRPRLFEFYRGLFQEWRLTILGIRIHYHRSYGGRFT